MLYACKQIRFGNMTEDQVRANEVQITIELGKLLRARIVIISINAITVIMFSLLNDMWKLVLNSPAQVFSVSPNEHAVSKACDLVCI